MSYYLREEFELSVWNEANSCSSEEIEYLAEQLMPNFVTEIELNPFGVVIVHQLEETCNEN